MRESSGTHEGTDPQPSQQQVSQLRFEHEQQADKSQGSDSPGTTALPSPEGPDLTPGPHQDTESSLRFQAKADSHPPHFPSISSITSNSSVQVEPYPDYADVVIVGAGPAGLTLGIELARRGVDFLIFDINARSVGQSRALLLPTRTLEIFADLGVAESAIVKGQLLRGCHVNVNSQSSIDLKFSGVQTQFPFCLALEQSRTEKILLDRLYEFGGRTVRRPVAVWKVEVPETKDVSSTAILLGDPKLGDATTPANVSAILDAHAVLANARGVGESMPQFGSLAQTIGGSLIAPSPSGANSPVLGALGSFMAESLSTVYVKPLDYCGRPVECAISEVRCRYVVGADGVRSSVRQALHVDFEPRGPLSEYVVADLIVEWSTPLATDRFHVLQSSKAILVSVPMTSGRWRIIYPRGGVLETDGSRKAPFARGPAPEFSDLELIVSQVMPGTLIEKCLWCATYALSPSIAKAFRRSFGCLIGDAAHIHVPMFGQGMNSGIQDAYNLGWKLAAVLKGAPISLLDTFNDERRSAAECLLDSPSRIFESLTRTGVINRCVLTVLAPLLNGLELASHNFSRIMSQTDIRYAPSAIVYKDGRMETGARLPDAAVVAVRVANGDADNTEMPRPILTLSRGGRHTLFLCIHVLPHGTKAKTVFGCERNEEALRWNVKSLDRLARLARVLSEAFRGREAEIAWGGLKVVWVLCGLINFQSPTNTVGFGQIRDHVPHRLLFFFSAGARVGTNISVVVDYEGEVHRHWKLRLADPDGVYGGDRSGAFLLLRPDGHTCCAGYAGDRLASSFALDYVVSSLST